MVEVMGIMAELPPYSRVGVELLLPCSWLAVLACWLSSWHCLPRWGASGKQEATAVAARVVDAPCSGVSLLALLAVLCSSWADEGLTYLVKVVVCSESPPGVP